MKGFLVLFLMIALGLWVADRFVIKDPSDANDSGFIEAQPGLGLDDAARALVVALFVLVGGKLARKFIGGRPAKV